MTLLYFDQHRAVAIQVCLLKPGRQCTIKPDFNPKLVAPNAFKKRAKFQIFDRLSFDVQFGGSVLTFGVSST